MCQTIRPGEAVGILQVNIRWAAKSEDAPKATDSSAAGRESDPGLAPPPGAAWTRPGITFVRPLASGESAHVPP